MKGEREGKREEGEEKSDKGKKDIERKLSRKFRKRCRGGEERKIVKEERLRYLDISC